METSRTTTDAAQSWMDYIRTTPKQAGLDTHAQGKQPEAGAPSPVLDTSATQTTDQLAIAEGLKALEKLKRSIA